MTGLVGKKVGMTQVFADNGESVPVTVVEAGPCTVVQRRTVDKDGYSAVQVGFGNSRDILKSRALSTHMQAAGGIFGGLAEFRCPADAEYEVGQEIGVADLFDKGDSVDVAGTSKGRGFAGVMKRHGFKGGSATHGTHESFRGGGAIGACAYPGRVFKGKKMPGHMGNTKVTTQNLEVVEIRAEDNLVLVRGGIPGPRGGRVVIRLAIKAPPKPPKAKPAEKDSEE